MISWREGGKRRYLGAPNEEIAARMLATIVDNLALNKVGLPGNFEHVPTLNELAGDWFSPRSIAWKSVSLWHRHLGPSFGALRPDEVTPERLSSFIGQKLADGLRPATVSNMIRCLSSWMSEHVRLRRLERNPISELSPEMRDLLRSDYDTASTPFLTSLEDVRRVFLALPEPINVAFAVGAFAGLRTAEIIGLLWECVDIKDRKIVVRWQAGESGNLIPPKGGERQVIIPNALAPCLAEWRLKTEGDGLLFQPTAGKGGSHSSPPVFMRPHTLHKHLATALQGCGLPALTWYQCTRHTFATMWVREGGNMEALSKCLGHASVETSLRYIHCGGDISAPEHLAIFSEPS